MNAPRQAEAAVVSNKRHAREQEGFQRTLGPENADRYEALRCATFPFGWPNVWNSDSRGSYAVAASPTRLHIDWETSPAETTERTVFTWMGGSRTYPAFAPAFPYVSALLSVDGGRLLRFPIGRPEGFRVQQDGLVLEFEPRQFHSLVDGYQRTWDTAGISGFYRLHVDGGSLTRGRPLRLRIELDPSSMASLVVIPRTDCLSVDLRILRDELALVQSELVGLKRSHEMLFAQVYPELFPQRVRGERVIVTQDERLHLHPANLTVLADGEVVVTMREGTDHLSRDGRMMIVRSRDGGRTWGPRELMFDRGGVDHRGSPIFELPDGEWVTTDYRPGDKDGIYDEQGVYRPHAITGPSVWGAWSRDRGRTWSFAKRGFSVPGSHSQYTEVERHMIRLPSGRLLAGAAFYSAPEQHHGAAVFASDDGARSWSWLATVPTDPRAEPEITLLRTASGKIILLARTSPSYGTQAGSQEGLPIGCLLQSESRDDGVTWSAFRETGLSSLSTPAHLLQLQDGRILCTHATRAYPGSIYVTTSADEGATWDTQRTRIIANDLTNFDTTYPTSGQLADGTVITTWYANLFGKYFIPALRYRPEQL